MGARINFSFQRTVTVPFKEVHACTLIIYSQLFHDTHDKQTSQVIFVMS